MKHICIAGLIFLSSVSFVLAQAIPSGQTCTGWLYSSTAVLLTATVRPVSPLVIRFGERYTLQYQWGGSSTGATSSALTGQSAVIYREVVQGRFRNPLGRIVAKGTPRFDVGRLQVLFPQRPSVFVSSAGQTHFVWVAGESVYILILDPISGTGNPGRFRVNLAEAQCQ